MDYREREEGDALASQGLCTIALIGGVWGFRGTNAHGGEVILPDWEHVALNGREVVVVYDSDLETNPKVQDALNGSGRCYAPDRPSPARVHWPETMQQSKVGVDDFFAQGHTLDELRALIPRIGPLPAQAPRARPPETSAADPAAAFGTVHPCTHVTNARRLVQRYQPTLRYVVGMGWIMWTGTFWRPDPTTDAALATGFVDHLAQTIAAEAATLYAAAAPCAGHPQGPLCPRHGTGPLGGPIRTGRNHRRRVEAGQACPAPGPSGHQSKSVVVELPERHH